MFVRRGAYFGWGLSRRGVYVGWGLEYKLKYNYVTIVQLKVDEENHYTVIVVGAGEYRNPQITKFTKITKYELWNLYITQNKYSFFYFQFLEFFPKQSNNSKVFWHF